MRILIGLWGLLSSTLVWAALPALSLEQIMADPDWIGTPVEDVWWSADGQSLHYRVKREGSDLRDIRELQLASGKDQLAEAPSGENPVWSSDARRMLYVRDGDLYLYNRDSDQHRQLTRSLQSVAAHGFQSDGLHARFRSGNRWLLVNLDSGLLTEVATLRFERRPDQPKEDALREAQLRLSTTLARQRERQDEGFLDEHQQRLSREHRAPPPIWMTPDLEAEASYLSPDGRQLILVTRKKSADAGQRGEMPIHVTESGYEETETVRTRVGRNAPVAHALWRIDLSSGEASPIDLQALPGIRDQIDVTAVLGAERISRRGRTVPQQENPRDLRVMNVKWSGDGQHAAIMLRAIDNKDRWLVALDHDDDALRTLHRLSDAAWINWSFNDYDWLPDHRTLWFLSEQTGYSHLYEIAVSGGRERALTQGEWEVSQVSTSLDGAHYHFVANQSSPVVYELYRLTRSSGASLEALTALRGVDGYALYAGGQHIALRHSGPYQPPGVSLLDSESLAITPLVDRRSENWRQLDWPELRMVEVPSSDVDRVIWSKLYLPQDMQPEQRYPAVLFVHGAGYLQNSHWRWPVYFREQMFHHLLTQHGVVVLDMDFRASRGYGRDWRTAIYRQMGTPELQDLLDGVDWLAEHHQVDPERIGVYGGSYGGFMALMALFKTPDRFVAGAALRPVTDWMHYNHPYTSNILNTPEQDPEAYARSSPIEFAENFNGQLLISHGMLDDNVFYQDAVRLAQRLIELRKPGWEMASYPLERHGFVHPESWYDQYRRIFELFEESLGFEVQAERD